MKLLCECSHQSHEQSPLLNLLMKNKDQKALHLSPYQHVYPGLIFLLFLIQGSEGFQVCTSGVQSTALCTLVSEKSFWWTDWDLLVIIHYFSRWKIAKSKAISLHRVNMFDFCSSTLNKWLNYFILSLNYLFLDTKFTIYIDIYSNCH